MLYPTYITYAGTGRTGLIHVLSNLGIVSFLTCSFIKTSPTINIFKKRFMAFFEVSSSLYGVNDPVDVRYLTRLRVGLSFTCP